MSNLFSALGIVLVIAILLVISWVLVHLLAAFGIFMAVAYPLLVYPGWQSFVTLPASVQNMLPKTFGAALKGSLFLLVMTVISGVIVFGESQLLSRLGFPPTPKTVSFVIPQKRQYRLGEIFPMKVEITGIKVPINAVQADLSYAPEKLEVLDVSTDGSFASIFVQKEINNDTGYIRLTGGLPNPGFFSDHGTFGTVYFKGKSPGTVQIEYLPTSMVLANDGRGTNVLKDLSAVSYLILPEKMTQEEIDVQNNTFRSVVLGENSQNTMMTFYDESSVLGTETAKKMPETIKPDFLSTFEDLLSQVDKMILDGWSKVFGLFNFSSNSPKNRA